MNKWLEKGSWGLPVIINVLVGGCLFLANGLNLYRVWHAEMAITVITVLYIWLLTRIPIHGNQNAADGA